MMMMELIMMATGVGEKRFVYAFILGKYYAEPVFVFQARADPPEIYIFMQLEVSWMVGGLGELVGSTGIAMAT